MSDRTGTTSSEAVSGEGLRGLLAEASGYVAAWNYKYPTHDDGGLYDRIATALAADAPADEVERTEAFVRSLACEIADAIDTPDFTSRPDGNAASIDVAEQILTRALRPAPVSAAPTEEA